jgi:hypothetical protein
VQPFNPLDENHVRAHRDQVLEALRDLSEGKVPFLDGVRRVLALTGETRGFDRDIDILVAIDSETTHLPSESAKKYCSQDWLQMCETEERQIESISRAEVQELCRTLITRFQGGADA